MQCLLQFIYFAEILEFPNLYCLEVRCMHNLLYAFVQFHLKNLIHSIHRNLRDMVFTRFNKVFCFCCFNEETDQFFNSRETWTSGVINKEFRIVQSQSKFSWLQKLKLSHHYINPSAPSHAESTCIKYLGVQIIQKKMHVW